MGNLLNYILCENENLDKCLISSLNKLLERDVYLFKIGCHERAIAHKLACYIEQYLAENPFPDCNYDVDLEYNRDGTDAKRLSSGKLRIPDIIIHQRGINDNNLLILELKLTSSVEKENRSKLKDTINKFKYKYGLALTLTTGTDSATNLISTCKWIAK